MWSIGVLLYVMLSKTMPFRAKEVDQLLKQVRLTKIRVQTEQGCTQPNWCMGIHSWVNRRAHVRVHECI